MNRSVDVENDANVPVEPLGSTGQTTEKPEEKPELVIDAGNLAAAARKVRNALAGAPALVYQRAGLANSRSPDAR